MTKLMYMNITKSVFPSFQAKLKRLINPNRQNMRGSAKKLFTNNFLVIYREFAFVINYLQFFFKSIPTLKKSSIYNEFYFLLI